jgi:hypothetical protein
MLPISALPEESLDDAFNLLRNHLAMLLLALDGQFEDWSSDGSSQHDAPLPGELLQFVDSIQKFTRLFE